MKDRTCRVWDLLLNTCRAVGEGHADAIGTVGIASPKEYDALL